MIYKSAMEGEYLHEDDNSDYTEIDPVRALRHPRFNLPQDLDTPTWHAPKLMLTNRQICDEAGIVYIENSITNMGNPKLVRFIQQYPDHLGFKALRHVRNLHSCTPFWHYILDGDVSTTCAGLTTIELPLTTRRLLLPEWRMILAPEEVINLYGWGPLFLLGRLKQITLSIHEPTVWALELLMRLGDYIRGRFLNEGRVVRVKLTLMHQGQILLLPRSD